VDDRAFIEHFIRSRERNFKWTSVAFVITGIEVQCLTVISNEGFHPVKSCCGIYVHAPQIMSMVSGMSHNLVSNCGKWLGLLVFSAD